MLQLSHCLQIRVYDDVYSSIFHHCWRSKSKFSMKYLLLFKDEARSVMLAILVDHWYGFREGIGLAE